MPRIRTVKPEFWADEKLGPLSPLTRLVFLGLISMADDQGRLVDSAKQIDAMLFPYTSESCADALAQLAGYARIERGETESGQRIIQITNWHQHQKVDNPSKYNLPPIVAPDTREGLARVSRDNSVTIYDLRPVPPTDDLRPASDELPHAHAREARHLEELAPNAPITAGEQREARRAEGLFAVPRYTDVAAQLTAPAMGALEGYCRSARMPGALVASVLALHERDGYDWPTIDRALVEYAAQATSDRVSANGLRAFCKKLKRGDGSGLTEGEKFLQHGDAA